MVISAMFKQKKNRAVKKKWEQDDLKPAKGKSPSQAPSPMGGIFEQIKRELKQELFQEEEILPPILDSLEVEPEAEEEIIVPPDYEEAQFVEGSPAIRRSTPETYAIDPISDNRTEGQTLGSILSPYSTIQQGIILHEILGKPRALQKNEDWFFNSGLMV